MANNDPLRIIKKALTWLVISTVVLYLTLGVVAFLTFVDAQQTHDGLCALRADLVVRINGSKKFLHEHPRGVLHISPAVIRTGIENEQRTVDALGSLQC